MSATRGPSCSAACDEIKLVVVIAIGSATSTTTTNE